MRCVHEIRISLCSYFFLSFCFACLYVFGICHTRLPVKKKIKSFFTSMFAEAYLLFTVCTLDLSTLQNYVQIKKKKTVEIAQLWQHNPRQLHYSNNLSKKKKKTQKKGMKNCIFSPLRHLSKRLRIIQFFFLPFFLGAKRIAQAILFCGVVQAVFMNVLNARFLSGSCVSAQAFFFFVLSMFTLVAV